MKIGLLGGTFDPIHSGHLAMAQEVLATASLDRVIFIPSGSPPHRRAGTVTPARHRLEMVRLAIADTKSFALSDVEIDRCRYSFETIEAMHSQYGGKASLYFITGLDAFLDLPNWREPRRLLNACHMVVVSRPGWRFQAIVDTCVADLFGRAVAPKQLQALDAGLLNRFVVSHHTEVNEPRTVTFLRIQAVHISSTDIRLRVNQGKAISHLLPASVESYILTRRLYTAERIRAGTSIESPRSGSRRDRKKSEGRCRARRESADTHR